MNIKNELIKKCEIVVGRKLKTIKERINSSQEALYSETKSSAGDKHETSRAMLQIEIEKAGKQIASIKIMREILAKINFNKQSECVALGTIVYTDSINYFISIPVGEIILEEKSFFAISAISPIGKLLIGKRVNDKISYNQKVITLIALK